MGWEHANVRFHELGHALHMLLCKARYSSLGSMQVPWDFVDIPALLNERWLYDRALIRDCPRHPVTSTPMSETLIDGIEAMARLDQVFSVSPDYLATAIIDLRLLLLADGRNVDAMAVEVAVLAELGMGPGH